MLKLLIELIQEGLNAIKVIDENIRIGGLESFFSTQQNCGTKNTENIKVRALT